MFNKLKKNTEPNTDIELNGVIGKHYEDGKTVFVRFSKKLPKENVISKFPWFTVISWKYSSNDQEGLPSKEIYERMKILDDTLENAFDSKDIGIHAYNRTGNSLREINYYISDRDKFLEKFNNALHTHEKYPIEITFYEDSEWNELKTLIKDFED